VWYQVFPERFRNGDRSNDPPGTQRWQSDWWSTLPGEKPGPENFYTGVGNVWQRRYGGDIQGARAALPYLKKLGVNAIYFNPIFEAESMHKYDTADFRHVDDNFGVKGDLARLAGETDDPATWQWTATDRLFLDFVHDAHQQGFKVIIDGVFNHVGRAHPLFQDVVRHGRDSKYSDWFDVEAFADHHPADPAQFGKPGGFRFRAWDGPSGHLPTFKKDAGRGLAAGPYAHVMAISKRWLAPDGDPSRGVDGWRLDVPGDIPHPFWKAWRKVCKDAKPDCYLTGEIWGWAQPWLGGDEFDAVMNYQFAMPALDFFADRRDALPPRAFGAAMSRVAFAYPFQVALVQQNLYDSHDTDRLASMFVNPDRPYDGANRLQDGAPYDRRKPNDEERRRMLQAVAMQMTFVGAPMIYYGDEAGMWSPDDPSNRQPMVWQDHEPFDDRDVRFDQQVFDSYQRLIAARASLPALRLGFFRTVLADDATGVYAFARELGDEHAYVVLNRSGESRDISVPFGSINAAAAAAGRTFTDWLDPAHAELAAGGDGRPVLRPRPGARRISVTDATIRLRLPPYGSALLD
jgi:glycosidase